MEQKKRNLVTLGSTGITVEKNSFGALPIQRISKEAAIGLYLILYNPFLFVNGSLKYLPFFSDIMDVVSITNSQG